jgi:transcription termination factor Rho
VSLDSFDLEGLQRKDRAELATIAQHLGGKPGSRAKKADIIAMILELAGVTDQAGPAAGTAAASDAAGSGAASETRAEPDASTDEAETAATDDAGAAGAGPAESDAPATSPGRARGGRREGGGPDRDESPGRQQDSRQQDSRQQDSRQQDSRQQDSRQQDDRQQDDRQQGGQRDRQQGDDQDRQQNQSDQQNQNGEGEGSRRRRRRRGRDRDRVDEQGDGGQSNWEGEVVDVDGILDLRDEGYGFLRLNGLLPSRDDVYVSVKQTRQFGLRRGDLISGASRPANRGEKNPALLRIDKVNGLDLEQARDRVAFEDLTPLFPSEPLRLERADHPYDMTGRIIDLIAPIGKGQRGLIVSPPKAGKTTIMKTIAQCIEANHPEVELMVLLVDERPEEVTDMRRSIAGEVVASTFDRPAEEHIAVAELAIERAKRVVEQGRDVVVILDGITRLARAHNLAAPNGGRIMSGGLDTGALYPPKRFFGAARNLEEGGSLTILATALVDTGSKMDEVIFEEFKGTGNMELRLDRRAAEKRVYPAIDVDGSSTRHEELLFDSKQLQQVWKLRRVLSALAAEGEAAAGLELIIDRMRKFPTNEVFLAEIAKAPSVG